MAVTTRQQLIDYCLRDLGEPVVEINIDDSQIEDRVDEAIEYWRQYHYDGIERVYLKQQITASRITITTNNGGDFKLSDIITGQTSGATAELVREADPTQDPGYVESNSNTLVVRNIRGDFQDGEVISNGTITATLAALNAVTK